MSQIQRLLEPHFDTIAAHIHGDPEFYTIAATTRCTFAIVSYEDLQNAVIVAVSHGRTTMTIEDASKGVFGIQARPGDWVSFFSEELVRPYQSFWGMLRVLGTKKGVSVLGDSASFAQNARIWRLVLDHARNVLQGKLQKTSLALPPPGEEQEFDRVVGRYIWIDTMKFGKVKVFYERSGTGSQKVLFMHTAGADGRQFHSLMNNVEIGKICSMVAFDFPAHGRSSLGSSQIPETYNLDEDSYLEVIGKIIKKLGLSNTIICGASMGGSICLAAATKARELGIRGAIPCEASEHHPYTQAIYAMVGTDASLLDPERVCGMCAPMSPEYHKKQIWWQYSSQGYKIFPGDLKFYFQGFDGRGRMEQIDTKFCPVYMLTGEYDYSCTVEASRMTAEKIPGAKFDVMPGLGHFPLTENPPAIVPFFLKAINFIQQSREVETEV